MPLPRSISGGGSRMSTITNMPSPLVLLLLLVALVARVVGTSAEFITYAGVSSSHEEASAPAKNAIDGNSNFGASAGTHFMSGAQRSHPWLAADLGGRGKVSSVHVFGHVSDKNCALHWLRSSVVPCLLFPGSHSKAP